MVGRSGLCRNYCAWAQTRLRYLIGHGLLRVRDAHITAASLAAFCEKNRETWEPSIMATVTIGLREDDAFSWEKVADLLCYRYGESSGSDCRWRTEACRYLCYRQGV